MGSVWQFNVFSVALAFRLELDGLRITAGENGLILHKTPDVSANQKGALRMFRFENSDNRLAAQRIRFSDASVQVLVIVAATDLVIARVGYWPAHLLFIEVLDGLVAPFSNFGVFSHGQKEFHMSPSERLQALQLIVYRSRLDKYAATVGVPEADQASLLF